MATRQISTPTRSEINHAMNAVDKSRRKYRTDQIIVTVLLIVGILVALYPMASTLQNNNKLARLTEEYADSVNVDSGETNDEFLASARAYNEDLSRRPFTPPPIGEEVTHERYAEYQSELSYNSPDDPMATITIPDANISLPVYHGTNDDVLYKGAGHLYGTHLPVGGVGTTSAISAHTGMVNASMFDNLQFLEIGQDAYIQVRGETLRYRMVERDVVPATATDAITKDPNRDLLVLITCTPYGINSDRLIVTMERVEHTGEVPETENTIDGWQWWMTGSIILVLIVLLIAIINAIMQRRRLVNAEKRYLNKHLGSNWSKKDLKA